MLTGRRSWLILLAIALPPAQLLAQAAAPSPSIDVLVLFGTDHFVDEAKTFAAAARADRRRTELLPQDVKSAKPYWIDRSLSGRDEEPALGVESASLVFNIGHGRSTNWDTYRSGNLPEFVLLRDVQAGDQWLRYLWLSSCFVMAHGPEPYDAPDTFATAVGRLKNVFHRWGSDYNHSDATTTPLAPGLRMACGGSTRLEPTNEMMTNLWAKLGPKGPPSDTFIEQFRADPRPDVSPPTPARVPLCITRGGEEATETPLYDKKLITTANQGGKYLFIQYPALVDGPEAGVVAGLLELLISGQGDGSVGLVDSGPPPAAAPVLTLDPLPLAPQQLLNAFLAEDARDTLGFRRLTLDRVIAILQSAESDTEFESSQLLADWSREASLFFHPCSGSLSLRGPSTAPKQLEGHPHPNQVELPEIKSDSFELMGMLGSRVKPATSAGPERRARSLRRIDMYIDRVHEANAGGPRPREIQHSVKHHRFEASSAVVLAAGTGRLHPVIGQGGTASLDIAPNGWPFAASLTTRRIAGCRDDGCKSEQLLPLKAARERAFAEAAAMDTRFQDEPHITWGYLEAPATCYQREMGIVYRFTFEPVPQESANALVVDVPAQVVQPWICVGDTEGGIPDNLPTGCELGSQ